MASVQGKKFNRTRSGEIKPRNEWDSVLTLPNGAGYLWLRLAFDHWLGVIDKLAPDVILIGHLRDKKIDKEGKQVEVRDLALTGRLSEITASKSDAIGYIYRKKNKTLINFSSPDDTAGSRCKHLQGEEVTIMEEDKEGNISTNWEAIYIE